jgi:uncharacterized protein (DUF2235 family)
VNLASNYQLGDEIYTFRFSRGAVAARAFTGLISKSGLILCDGLEHYGSVWDYFVLDTTLPANAEKGPPSFAKSSTQMLFPNMSDPE